MGCDGVWEMKNDKEMIDFIYDRLKTNTPHTKIVEELLDSIIAPDTLSKK